MSPMNTERSLFARPVALLTIFTIVGSALRLLPYWKEEYQSWLICIWGASAILPLFMTGVAKVKPLYLGYIIPLIGFIVSDLLIEWVLKTRNLPGSSITGRLMIYGLFLLLAQLGLVLRYLKLRRWEQALAGVGLTLFGSCSFFLVTNFLIWRGSTPIDGNYYYPPTWEGLLKCYEMALPFFKNQFYGDAVFSTMFFAIFALVETRMVAHTVGNTARASQ